MTHADIHTPSGMEPRRRDPALRPAAGAGRQQWRQAQSGTRLEPARPNCGRCLPPIARYFSATCSSLRLRAGAAHTASAMTPRLAQAHQQSGSSSRSRRKATGQLFANDRRNLLILLVQATLIAALVNVVARSDALQHSML